MSTDRESLKESVARLKERRDEFATELGQDLKRRHPALLGAAAAAEPDAIVAVIERFAKGELGEGFGGASPEDAEELADSIMKTFARVLGRAAWKPAMALAWHRVMQEEGTALVDALRELGP